ncbi:MAG: hypothetical protein UH542_06110 [Bacteroidales bacterium]|nr:hypothetical protein [Bacteroidales bacterium]
MAKKYVTLSTSHLKYTTKQFLSDLTKRTIDETEAYLIGLTVCERSESCSDKISGWIVHLLPVLSRKDIESFPADLAKCIEFAVQEGSDLIIFDQCECPINCLPTYDDSDALKIKLDTLQEISLHFFHEYKNNDSCYQICENFAAYLDSEIDKYNKLVQTQ